MISGIPAIMTTRTGTSSGGPESVIWVRSDFTTPYTGATPGTYTMTGGQEAFSSKVFTGNGYVEGLPVLPATTLDWYMVVHSSTQIWYIIINVNAGTSTLWYNGVQKSSISYATISGKYLRFSRSGDSISAGYSTSAGSSLTNIHTFADTVATPSNIRLSSQSPSSTTNGMTNATISGVSLV